MSVKTTIPLGGFFDSIRKSIEDIDMRVLVALEQSCLEFVNLARSTDTYKDQTSNLRSSIGYIIYKDGVEMARNFQAAGCGSENGGRGVAAAEAFANEETPSIAGYTVVVVAGMNYAKYVEAHGYEVITGCKEVLLARIPVWIKTVLLD